MNLASSFGRRAAVPPSEADRAGTDGSDLRRFLSAFAGGFIFFSILLL